MIQQKSDTSPAWRAICAAGMLSALWVPDVTLANSADAKRFEIVECVMPSTARKRGRNFSEIVRGGIQTTSAEECENFGGTYVPVTALDATLALWRPEAEKGDVNAQYRIASILEQGVRGKPDLPAAIDWYQRSNAQGDLRARASLVRLAQEGKWSAPREELNKLLGQSFNDGLEPVRSERDTLRAQLEAVQKTLAEKEAIAKQAKPASSNPADAASAQVLVAEVQRLRDINETYRQRMTVVEKVSDRLRLQLGAAPGSRDTSIGSSNNAFAELTIDIYDPPVPATRGAQVQVSPGKDGGIRVIGRASSPAGIRTVSVNDRPQAVASDGTFDIRAPLTRGSAKFIVKATDGANRTRQAEFELVSAGGDARPIASTSIAPAKLGNYHALVIGNNQYTKGWPALQTAVSDAKRMAEVLRNKYGFQVKLINDADRYATLSALNAYRQTLTESDNLLIFYAGHGQIDAGTGAAYWVPVDGEPKNNANWIAATEVTNMLRAMKAKNILIVADACYAGAFTYHTIPVAKSDLDAAERTTALGAMSARKSRTILTSGGNEPVLDSSDGKHSLFAAELLPLLEQNKQPLEASRIFMALAVRVHESANKLTNGAVSSEYSNQVPYYAALEHAGHELGDFVFAPTKP
jgi:Caspase domain